MSTHYPIAIIGGGLGGLTAARVLHIGRHRGDASSSWRRPRRPARRAACSTSTRRTARTHCTPPAFTTTSARSSTRAARPCALLAPTALSTSPRRTTTAVTAPRWTGAICATCCWTPCPGDMIRWGSKVDRRASAGRRTPRGGLRRRLHHHHRPVGRRRRRLVADPATGLERQARLHRHLVRRDRPPATQTPATRDSAAARRWRVLHRLGDQRGFLAHRETDGSLHVYTALQADEGWLDTVDFTDTAAAKAAVLAHFDGWDEGLRGLVADADGPLTPAPHPRPAHRTPLGPGPGRDPARRRRPPDVPLRRGGRQPGHARRRRTRPGHRGSPRRHRGRPSPPTRRRSSPAARRPPPSPPAAWRPCSARAAWRRRSSSSPPARRVRDGLAADQHTLRSGRIPMSAPHPRILQIRPGHDLHLRATQSAHPGRRVPHQTPFALLRLDNHPERKNATISLFLTVSV